MVPDPALFSYLAQWQGKVHFGIILGWSVLAAIVLWFVVNNIAGDSPDVRKCDLSSCYCVLGYALLPMVVFSVLSILLPKCACTRICLTLAQLTPAETPVVLLLRAGKGRIRKERVYIMPK